MNKAGERVGAILSIDEEGVQLLGYGEYVGRVVPDRPLGFLGEYESWDAVADMMNKTVPPGGTLWTADKVKMPNPLIRLDSGAEVWGAECWWGPEAKVKDVVAQAKAGGKKVVDLDARKVEGLRAFVKDN